MNSLAAQVSEIKRLKAIVGAQEGQMKDMKAKCAEHKNKISLNKVLEHHLKDVTMEETKKVSSKFCQNLNLDSMQ